MIRLQDTCTDFFMKLEDKEATLRRRLKEKRRAAAERKRLKNREERAQRAVIAKTAREQREDARQKLKEQRLAAGGKVTLNGTVLAPRVAATGEIKAACGRRDGREDKALVDRLLKALKDGHTMTDSAVFAGISYKTLNSWLNQGAEAPEGTIARDFYKQVELAKTMAIDDCVKSIKGAAKRGTWQAAAWFLEKRVPEVYGRRSEVALTQNKPFEVALVDAAFSEDEMKAALKAVLSKNPELAPPIVVEAETCDVE